MYRAVVDPAKGSGRSDIYYYTPVGKKLRSKVELELFCKFCCHYQSSFSS